jgi:site-specific DNA recombinase
VLERSVLSGLKTHLLSPELVKEFISEFHRETNRLNAERGRRSEAAKAELARVEVEIRHIIAAVKQGMVHASMQDALTQLEKRKATLACEVAATPLPPPVIHPNLAELYRRKVDRLHECLNAAGTRTEAAEALRCLVDEIRLVPQDGALAIDLYGELGAILALTNDKAASGRPRSGHSTLLVAGEGFEPSTFRL